MSFWRQVNLGDKQTLAITSLGGFKSSDIDGYMEETYSMSLYISPS